MVYVIENQFLEVQISDLGAEMTSIKSKINGCEYLWQGDKKYWGGHAPVMFPICGRLYEGKYTYRNKEYSMPNHGIARASVFDVTKVNDETVIFTLVSNDETKKMYPFDFIFSITFKLDKSNLVITYNVKNTDSKDLIFTVGAHPAFNVPLDKSGKFEDYYVEFERECDAYRVAYSEKCFCTKNDSLFSQGGTKRINLNHSLFDNDAIFLYNIPKKVTLASAKSQRSVTLTYEHMKYIGLWHAVKTDAPYICIEPWCGCPANEGIIDDLETKDEMFRIPPDFNYKNTFTISLN